MMTICTYIQTCIHIYEPKYILKCVSGSNSLGPSIMHKFFIMALFRFTHQWEETYAGEIPPMLLPKLSSVCIPCFKCVAQWVCLVKVPFLALRKQKWMWSYTFT